MSSISVTPQRRRRSVDDDEEEDLYSASPKRTRLDDGDEDEDEVEVEPQQDFSSSPPSGPLLPDGYRRSPKGKVRAQGPAKHQPGAIVRVTLTDFVTYTKAEFKPGPTLNMIIGPNGTGKSTLVCAICLGLGFKPDLLGRVTQASAFVKHGMKRAIIEIELEADPDRHTANPVITTKITRDGNKSEFMIDGKKASKKDLDRLTRSFSIQVDNLCQFLPQDRVAEFSRMTPVDLLVQTQRAAAPPEMNEWHDQLKAMRKEQKAKEIEQQSVTEDLKNKVNRQNQQQGMVERLRERSELQARMTNLEKLRPFPAYRAAKLRHTEARKRLKDAETELKQLEDQAAPNLRAEKDKEAYLKQIQTVVTKQGKMVERMESNADQKGKELNAKGEKIKECDKLIEIATRNKKDAKADMPNLNRQKTAIERHMANPPEQPDFAAYNADIREKVRELRECEGREQDLRQQTGSLRQQKAQREQVVARAEEEMASLQTQAGQQANKLKLASRHSAQAWDWIQDNQDKFQSEVFGPPMIVCTVRDPRHAAVVESIIGQSEMKAFTVTSRADFTTLSRELYDRQGLSDITIRQSEQAIGAFKPPCSDDRLRSLGLEAWIIDLMDGPDPVLAMLCDNRKIESAAFASRELNEQQLDTLRADNSLINSWVTPSDSWQVTRRREYGAAGTSARSRALQAAKFFTDAPSSATEDAEMKQRVEDAERDIEEYQRQTETLKAEYNELKQKQTQLNQERKELEDEKNRKQTAVAGFRALPTRLEGVQRKIDAAKDLMGGAQDRINAIKDDQDKLTLEKGQLAIDYANAVNVCRDHIVQHIGTQILAIEAQSDLEQMKLRTRAEKALLAERRKEKEELEVEKAELLQRGKELGQACSNIDGLDSDEALDKVRDEIENDKWTPDQLETEIQSVQARFDMTDGGRNGANLLKEFEERAIAIRKKEDKLEKLNAALEELEGKIKEVREQWEPQLDQLIAQISKAFGENMAFIDNAGEVSVHKDEDFELWAIQIRVKFRYAPSVLSQALCCNS